MSTYIGFNLNSNRQIEHFQTIENRYGINSDGGKFLFGQAELALKGSYIPKEEVYLYHIRVLYNRGTLKGSSRT